MIDAPAVRRLGRSAWARSAGVSLVVAVVITGMLGLLGARVGAIFRHALAHSLAITWLATWTHLPSRVGDRVQLIAVDQVTHVVARDRATFAVTPTSEHILDLTIAQLERKLDPGKFFRIHRGTPVNVSWLSELHADFGGRLLLRLRDERRTELVVARDRVRLLRQRLGLL